MAQNKSKTRKRIPIYVIAGKEQSLVNAECEGLVDLLLESEQRVTGLFAAEGGQVGASAVLDELRTLPFLSDRRVVVIKQADDFVSENRQLLEDYFDNPCESGVLVLCVNSWPSNTKLARKLLKAGKLMSVAQPKPCLLPGRLVKYADDAHGKRLSNDAAGLVVELVGDDLCLLYGEIDKLALFVGDRKSIGVADIEKLVGHNRLVNVFEVIESVTAGKIGRAVEGLRVMFSTDKSAEYTVVGAFAYHFRRMFNVKVLLEKGLRPEEIAKRLRIWGKKEAFFTQVRRFTLEQIGGVLGRLAGIDYAIKTGQTKAEVAIEQLVLKLVGSGCSD